MDQPNLDLQILINSSNIALHKDAVSEGAAFSFATEMLIHGTSYDTT